MTEEKDSSKAKNMLTKYVNKSLMDTFDDTSTVVRLAVAQRVPDKWIEQRQIGKDMKDYLPGWIATKILNFIFNFNISTKILDQNTVEYVQETSSYNTVKKAWTTKKSNVTEATVHMYFKFTTKEGQIIEREFISTQKSFENSALPKNDCLKGAISKSWTLAAHSFGIASNVKGQLHLEIADEVKPNQEEPIEGEVVEVTVPINLSKLPY